VLERQPNDAQARLIRIQARIGLKEGDKVRPDLEALVKQNPGFGDAVYQLATLYMAGKEYAKAQEQFQRLWEGTGPNKQPDLRGFIGLQEVKLRQGHSSQAIDALRDLVQKNPNQPSLRLTLANFQAEAALQLPESNAERQPLIEEAAANYQQIAKSLPNASETYIRLGTLYRMLNRNDDAIKAFDAAAKADPRNAEAFLNRAMVFEATGQTEKARAAYAQTLGVDPDNVVALNNLAFMNADANQNLDQAMTYAERAKKRLPTNASVSDTLGYVYLRKNLNEDAVRELQSAVNGDPKNASYRLHLAMALLNRGDKTGARREAAAALRTANTDQQEKIRSFINQIS
jgi:tetratricopeptide (TPR) repeat protein